MCIRDRCMAFVRIKSTLFEKLEEIREVCDNLIRTMILSIRGSGTHQGIQNKDAFPLRQNCKVIPLYRQLPQV